MKRRIGAALAFVMGLASGARAQDAVSDLAKAQSQTRSGDVVHMTDVTGRAFKWRLSGVPVDALVRQAGLSNDDVAELAIERTDSPWNGALIGLAIAGTPWLIACAANDWCYYNEYGAENMLRTTALTSAAIGAGVGALIDLSVRRRITLFRRASKRAVVIEVSPTVSRRHATVRVSATF